MVQPKQTETSPKSIPKTVSVSINPATGTGYTSSVELNPDSANNTDGNQTENRFGSFLNPAKAQVFKFAVARCLPVLYMAAVFRQPMFKELNKFRDLFHD